MACETVVLEVNALFTCVDLQAWRNILGRSAVAIFKSRVAALNGIAQRSNCCKAYDPREMRNDH